MTNISEDIEDQTITQNMSQMNESASYINALYDSVLFTLRTNLKSTTTSQTATANINKTRTALLSNQVLQNAMYINLQMVPDVLIDGTLKKAWDFYYDKGPDPMDLYITMKQFSLRYQKSLSHAVSIMIFLANTDPTNIATDHDKRLEWISSCPDTMTATKITRMMAKWDQDLEGQSDSVIDSRIYQMAQALLVDSGLGKFPMFWDRCGDWGVRLQPDITVDGKSTDMIGLADRCTDTQDLCGISYLAYDSQA